MKKLIPSLFPVIVLAVFISSCKKEKDKTEETAGEETSSVIVKMNHNWEGNVFAVNEDSLYINSETNDTLSFTKLRYYISNIKLKRADGSFYIQPDSYFLVDSENPASLSLNLGNVPAGNYTDLYYTFGVDSTHNVSGSQSGALDPVNQMFWTWSSGYIMLKAEGISPNSQTGGFAFHLGGFYGANSVVIEKHIDLTAAGSLSASSSAQRTIFIDVPVNALWEDVPTLATYADAMNPGPLSRLMALSFTGAMSLNHIE